MSLLSQAIKLSENNAVEQNSEVLGKVAFYSSELATFLSKSDIVIINTTVSHTFERNAHTPVAY